MTKAKRVRDVYAELQYAVGDIAADSELLAAAANIVELSEPLEAEGIRFQLYQGGIPFDRWALDRAMSDGGWRVLAREANTVRQIFDDDRDAVSERIELEHWMMELAA